MLFIQMNFRSSVGKLSQQSDTHPAESIKLINVDSEKTAKKTNISFEKVKHY